MKSTEIKDGKHNLKLKLLKFDTINPHAYLDKMIKENKNLLSQMDRKRFLEWIISTRGNFSDFYTYNLRKSGFESEEFFTNDYYIDKVADEIYGSAKKLHFLKTELKNKVRPVVRRKELNIIYDYITRYEPDIILVREQIGIPSYFWKNFRNKSLLVSRLAAPFPRDWFPADWDLILTSTEVFREFFELNGAPSIINSNGFDLRILDELKDEGKKYGVTFVGGLGNRYWIKRTKCFEYISERTDFKWWGYNNDRNANDSPLNKTWQGLTSGLDMLQIYRNSEIVLNDYGEIAGGIGVNQRLFEALGVGSFLLTRESENLIQQYPKNLFETFRDEKDCVDKINYFLKNEKEREEIAAAGQKYVLENFNYEKLMKELSVILKEYYERKFSNNGREHKG